MLRYAQRAEALGFDSVWVPDHFFFEGPPGVLTPYPEAWTLMTAIAATTERWIQRSRRSSPRSHAK